MITDKQLLYNRHLLSRHQIETHFGDMGETRVLPDDELFQTADAFLHLTDALQSAKIDFIPLKGPVLSHLIYHDYSARRFYDLDFLVAFNDVERFSRLLSEQGYKPLHEWPSSRREQNLQRKRSHHLLMQCRKNGTDIEIHWRLFSHYKFPDMSFEQIYREHTIPYTIDGRSFRKLSNELELLFLLVHGSKHLWLRLKWLIDVNDYLRNVPVNLDLMNEIAAQNGLENMIRYYNIIAKVYIPQACTIAMKGKERDVPSYIKRHTNNTIHTTYVADARVEEVKSSISTVTGSLLLELYLAPDGYSIYLAIKKFLIGALPRFLVQFLRLIKRRSWPGKKFSAR